MLDGLRRQLARSDAQIDGGLSRFEAIRSAPRSLRMLYEGLATCSSRGARQRHTAQWNPRIGACLHNLGGAPRENERSGNIVGRFKVTGSSLPDRWRPRPTVRKDSNSRRSRPLARPGGRSGSAYRGEAGDARLDESDRPRGFKAFETRRRKPVRWNRFCRNDRQGKIPIPTDEAAAKAAGYRRCLVSNHNNQKINRFRSTVKVVIRTTRLRSNHLNQQ